MTVELDFVPHVSRAHALLRMKIKAKIPKFNILQKGHRPVLLPEHRVMGQADVNEGVGQNCLADHEVHPEFGNL